MRSRVRSRVRAWERSNGGLPNSNLPYLPIRTPPVHTQSLLDDLNGSATWAAVKKHLNEALQKLKCHKLAVDPNTNEAYKVSFDGNAMRNLIADLCRGLVDGQVPRFATAPPPAPPPTHAASPARSPLMHFGALCRRTRLDHGALQQATRSF